MEGVLDWVLREMLSAVGGLDRMVTEFVRVTDRLLPDHVYHRYSPELKTGGRTQAGTPVFVQLLGGQPGPMAENAALASSLGAPGIDLNFGCPAKTVNRHDGGAALLREPDRVFKVTSAVRSAVPSHLPVTAKVRLGFENKDLHREIGAAAEAGGAAQVVVHARTKAEMYKPPAHWEYIRSMKEGRSVPFIANGEIWSAEDYLVAREVSGVTGAALGRGLVRRPTLAWEIRAAVAREQGLLVLPRYFDAGEFLRDFFLNSRELRGDAFALARTKQLLRYWAPGDVVFTRWFDSVKRFSTAQEAEKFMAETLPTGPEASYFTEEV